MRVVQKSEALALFEANRRELLGDRHGCVMCALAAFQQSRAEFVTSSENGIAVVDRFGTRPGHLLVIAREHIEDTAELPWELYIDLQALAYDACRALRRPLQPQRIFVAVCERPPNSR